MIVERVFGNRHLSITCIYRSFIASILPLCFVLALVLAVGITATNRRIAPAAVELGNEADDTRRRTIRLRPRSCHRLHEAMHSHCRSAVLKGVVLQERDLGECGERLLALRLVLNRALDQRHRDALGRAVGEIRHERVRRLALRNGLGDGDVKGRCDFWDNPSTRRCSDEAPSLSSIVGELHLRALAVGRCMIESQRQATQSLRKPLCTRSIAASRAALKESYGLLIRQHIQRDLIGYFTPVRKPGRDQHTRPSGWQKVWYLIRRADIVVNEEPCRALFR